jgi:acyl-CoA synthetase (AMP-forming)/AMP-acid ligase II
MNWEQLLTEAPQSPLITWQGHTWSRNDWQEAVDEALRALSRCPELTPNDFILLTSQDPFSTFSYLIAMTKAGYRVCLPQRDLFGPNSQVPTFAKQILTPRQGRIEVSDNPSYRPINIPHGNVICFSSGSTGNPKGVVHPIEHFWSNAASVATLMDHSDTMTNLTFLKPYLVSAICHFMVHLLKGWHLIFEDYSKLASLRDLTASFPTLGIVGSPVQVMGGVYQLPSSHTPGLFFSSGDMISASAIKRILTKFPMATYYNVYGLAELAGRFFVNRITKNDTNRADLLGTPIPGVIPSILDGHLLVESNFLFLGYALGDEFQPAENPHDSGDLVEETDAGFRLIGRSNEEIKVLGNKINLKYLETKIKNILSNDDLALLALPDKRFGNLLSLALVNPQTDRNELITTLRNGV